MRIPIIVEGRTEQAFMPALRGFLSQQLSGRMPNLDPLPYHGRIPTGEKLKRVVESLLEDRKSPVEAVIALTDVYTGSNEFVDAADARDKMSQWVGLNPKFYPHAAQYDFEAWLLPYWSTIQRLADHNRTAPRGLPESVNHNNPPAHRIKEVFEIGKCKYSYMKPRDGAKILRENNLMVAVQICPELKAFVNTILSVAGGDLIR